VAAPRPAHARLHLTVARDAGSAVESGIRLLDLLDDLAVTEEEVLTPIAEGSLSLGDRAAVRELEVGVRRSPIAATCAIS